MRLDAVPPAPLSDLPKHRMHNILSFFFFFQFVGPNLPNYGIVFDLFPSFEVDKFWLWNEHMWKCMDT